jgi:hypothetical protein
MHELAEDEPEEEVTDLFSQEAPALRERFRGIAIEEEEDVAAGRIEEAQVEQDVPEDEGEGEGLIVHGCPQGLSDRVVAVVEAGVCVVGQVSYFTHTYFNGFPGVREGVVNSVDRRLDRGCICFAIVRHALVGEGANGTVDYLKDQGE